MLSDTGNAYASQLGLTFEVPNDLQQIYSSFGINLPEFHNDPKWILPIPTRLVVAADRTIRSIQADPDYTVRPEPEGTLEILSGLG